MKIVFKSFINFSVDAHKPMKMQFFPIDILDIMSCLYLV